MMLGMQINRFPTLALLCPVSLIPLGVDNTIYKMCQHGVVLKFPSNSTLLHHFKDPIHLPDKTVGDSRLPEI